MLGLKTFQNKDLFHWLTFYTVSNQICGNKMHQGSDKSKIPGLKILEEEEEQGSFPTFWGTKRKSLLCVLDVFKTEEQKCRCFKKMSNRFSPVSINGTFFYISKHLETINIHVWNHSISFQLSLICIEELFCTSCCEPLPTWHSLHCPH